MAKIKKNCINCGKVVERYPSQILETVYCSRKCRSEHFREYNTVLFNCDYCGKSKRIRKANYKSEGNHFCSRTCKDEWQKTGLVGENNPFFNRNHSLETKEKVSETKIAAGLRGENSPQYNRIRVKCEECGEEIYKIPYLIARSDFHFCSPKCSGAWKSKHQVGESHPLWNPEITIEERTVKRKYPEYYTFMKVVMERDNYTCDICGKYSKWGNGLNAHHLNGYDWDKENRTNPDNGITLCKECHVDFHKIYGFGENTKLQYIEYKQNKRIRESG